VEQFYHKIKTYITHNKGASWELLRAPASDMRGKPNKCFLEDGCSLHLNMYSNKDKTFAPPYSQESAIGIVMAVGNLNSTRELVKAHIFQEMEELLGVKLPRFLLSTSLEIMEVFWLLLLICSQLLRLGTLGMKARPGPNLRFQTHLFTSKIS
jgi:hypothetical protein